MIRLALRLLRVGAITLVATILAVLAAERYAATRYAPDRLVPVDALIVLGGGVNPDNTQNYIGRRRAEAAAGILLDDRARVAIATGTLGDPTGLPEGEAGLLASQMIASGVAPARIVLEPAARTTLENLTLSFALGDAAGHRRYAIVTDAFHLPRALALAALIGREADGVAAAGFLEHGHFARMGLVVRESLAWWYNIAKAAAWIGLGWAGWSVDERREAVF